MTWSPYTYYMNPTVEAHLSSAFSECLPLSQGFHPREVLARYSLLASHTMRRKLLICIV